MKNLKKEIIQGIKIVTLALMLSVGVSYVFADWTQPLTAPPGCESGNPGCDAPIHVGAVGQTKIGNLIINGQNASGGSYANGLVVLNGKVGFGTNVPNTKLTVQAGGVNGINLAADSTDSRNSGRLFFSNATTVFSIFGSNQFLEFSHSATPGSSSGIRALRISKVGADKSLVSIPSGSIQIVDGTQGAGKVLTSDANGLASWTTPTGGTTTIIGGTTNTINVTNTGTTVTIDADMEGICLALSGTWNSATSKCSGIGSTSSSGVSSITAGNNNITVTSTGAGGTGAVTVSANISALCQSLGGTWNSATSKCSDIGGSFEIAQAFRADGGSTAGAIVTVQGPSTAFLPLNQVPPATGTQNAAAGSTNYGIQCNASEGWKLTGCWTHGDPNPDIYPYANGCLTNDYGQDTVNLSIACIKGGGTGGSSTGGVSSVTGSNGIIANPTTGAVNVSASPSGICGILGGTWDSATSKCSIAGAAGTVASTGHRVDVSAVGSTARYALGACVSTQRIEQVGSVTCNVSGAQRTVDNASQLSGSNPTNYTIRLGAWGSNAVSGTCTLLYRCLYQ